MTVLLVILTLAVILIRIFVVTPLRWCGEDVKKIDGQCIGVTDGSVPLSADLEDVLGKIRQENDRVEHEDPDAVSVAYLLPVPKPSSDDELLALMHHELEGAYLAQLQANQTKTSGEKPLIRLLVANSGEESSQEDRVVSDLLDKAAGPERLVTVVVTGKTKTKTIDAIDSLRRGNVPVVASRLAGESLSNLNETAQEDLRGGLARLAPTSNAQAAAATTYLRPIASRALVVQDTNPGDPYLKSLGAEFRRTFPDSTHTVLERIEEYDSRLDGYTNTMRGILGNICQQRPDVVFFAGRSPGLAALVQALPTRTCLDLPINIVAGGDTVEFATTLARGDKEIHDGLLAKASVKYTTQAHPKSWEVSPEFFSPGAVNHFTSTCDQCFHNLFPGESLEDGGAIIGYDAVVTVVTAIRPPYGGMNNKPDLVSQQFNRMHGTDAVPGASGWISLDDDGTPVNKAVDILEVKPDGALEFVTLSAPKGSPCVPGISPC
jgi:ABC-type branched-subunit amino acid transport system substrate-binding protein